MLRATQVNLIFGCGGWGHAGANPAFGVPHNYTGANKLSAWQRHNYVVVRERQPAAQYHQTVDLAFVRSELAYCAVTRFAHFKLPALQTPEMWNQPNKNRCDPPKWNQNGSNRRFSVTDRIVSSGFNTKALAGPLNESKIIM